MSNKVFALTICGYRKLGMDEDEYHRYLSDNHAPLLKDLLIKNKIIDYTMQHNTSETKKMMGQIFGSLHAGNVAECDCFVQIVFRDVQDFINVKEDPHYKKMVVPDHENFADGKRTTIVTGWFESHMPSRHSAAIENGTSMNGH